MKVNYVTLLASATLTLLGAAVARAEGPAATALAADAKTANVEIKSDDLVKIDAIPPNSANSLLWSMLLLPTFIIRRKDVAEFLNKLEKALKQAAKLKATQNAESKAQPMVLAAAR